MKTNPSALTVVIESIIIGAINFYRPVFTCLLTLIVSSMMISPTYGQKNSGFDDFIRTLDKTAVGNRQKMAEQFMAKIDKTPIVEGERVHFVWFGKADTVMIEGELQNSWAI